VAAEVELTRHGYTFDSLVSIVLFHEERTGKKIRSGFEARAQTRAARVTGFLGFGFRRQQSALGSGGAAIGLGWLLSFSPLEKGLPFPKHSYLLLLSKSDVTLIGE
jgi:hypothetical protein